jgi:hypothetical protein
MKNDATEHVVRIIFLDAAPSPDDVKAKASAANAGPHDILIVKGGVWCFVKGEAFPHPAHDDHAAKALSRFREAMLVVHAGDSVAWTCEQPIAVYLSPVEPPDRTPLPIREPGWYPEPQPFANPLPFLGRGALEPARSGVVKQSAKNTQYKVRILIGGTMYDPDIFCGNGFA